MLNDLQFTAFFTDFQSYQDDRRGIIKGWCNGIPVTVERVPSLVDFEPKTATVRGQKFTSFQECLALNS